MENRTGNILFRPGFLLFCLGMIVILASCKSGEQVTERETPEKPVVIPELEEPVPSDQFRASPMKDSAAIADIDSLLEEMTLREKIGQLFIVPANGTFRNEHDVDLLRLKRLVSEFHVGGIIFMRGDIYGQALLTNQLQEVASIPLWITQDMEFGAAMRVQGSTRFTPAMGIAATNNPANAYLKGKITAREAKALGVHQIFAPVLDVNNNPDNPVINVRSFSSDPKWVSRFGQFFIDGVESEGVLATAKHFPGHGDTDVDSHLALPVIRHHYSRIDSLELQPFRDTILNGLQSVMSAHISYPNISDQSGLPGTLDRSILNRILVDSLGFQGLIVTDGLEMKGITDNFSPGDAVVKSLKAGADIMLISPDVMTAVSDVEKAVQQGILPEERIDQSVRKLLTLKAGKGLFERKKVNIEDLTVQINTPVYQAVADQIARQSVTVLRNRKNILPIRDKDYLKVMVVAVSDNSNGNTGSNLARQMRNYHADVSFHSIDKRTSFEEAEEILKTARQSDLIVVGSFIMVRSHQPIQIPSKQLRLLRRIFQLQKPSVLMAFGNPYVIRDLPGADVQLLAWSSDGNQVRQAVPALFGASYIRGVFPAQLPGIAAKGSGLQIPQTVIRHDIPESAGMSADSLLAIDSLMQEAIDDSVFPGGVVAVMRKGQLVWNQPYGYHDYDKLRAVQDSDIYDLASLTKVMATTTAVMKLVDQGELSLDHKVSRYIPEFSNREKRSITIRQLLLHTSGLPAFRVYVDELRTRKKLLNAIKHEPLIHEPGEEYVYSDLGFIILAEIVEEVSGQRLDRFIRSQMFYPMGLYSAHFNPRSIGKWLSGRIPPTEIDTVYGRGLVQADVHDERAYFMDGVAGHAGMFSNSRDLAAFSYMLLNGGWYGGEQYLSKEVIDLFTSRQSSINQRGLGFDRKSDGFSTAGSLTGPRTFGHLGFTGTSLWIDPDQELAIILLTNRTFPNRSYGSKISQVRSQLADIVMKSILR